MTEVSTRQFILISLFVLIASKLMSMPIFVFGYANKDAIFVIIISLIIELIVTYFICQVIKNNPNTSLFDLLKNKLSKPIAYIIIVLLYVFILSKIIFTLQEIYTFFNEFLYEGLDVLIFIIPTYFVIGYLAFKGIRTLGRVLEIIYIFIGLGLVITVISNLEFLSFDSMLPYFEEGINPTLNGLKNSMFYFGNSICLLAFVGKVKINDNFTKKIMLSTSILAVFIIAFCFIFYDVYGYATQFTLFALSDYAQYDPFMLELQRLNWLSTTVDIIKLFCSASIFLYTLGQLGHQIVPTKSTFAPLLITLGLIYICSKLTNFDLNTLKNYISLFASYVTIGIIILSICLCIILNIKGAKNEQKSIQ